jgi:hypothetical protein
MEDITGHASSLMNAAAASGGVKASVGGAAAFTGVGVAGAAAVVMAVTMPKSKKDFLVALLSTLVSSFAGGAYVVVHHGLLAALLGAQSELELYLSLLQLLGVSFVCGLPGWFLVQSVFAFMAKRKGAGLDEVISDTVNIFSAGREDG